MVRKIKLANTDNLERRYLAGETVTKLAREWGVSQQTIIRHMHNVGVYQKVGRRVRGLDIPAIISDYHSGMSVNALSKKHGVSRLVVSSRLRESGIEPRGQSEAETLKWSQMTVKQKATQVAAAHEAVRGREPTIEEMIMRANTTERKQLHITKQERILGGLLIDSGLSITPQKAVGIYNLDIALDAFPIAIEIYGGRWHAIGRHKSRHFERTVYLLNSGWHVIILWGGKASPVSVNTCHQIHSLVDLISRNEALPAQYWVMCGNGDSAPVRNSYFNSQPTVETLGCCYDPSGRHYYIAG